MVLKNLFIGIFLLLSLLTKAQINKEAWNWNFGHSVSLDFSSGVPVAGLSPIDIMEGCASISDPITGQLLFFTDGDTVWDRNNHRMPNGVGLINGIQGTTTQAATIVPRPGHKNLYYIITADYGAASPNKGVFYSVVDLNLNGGLGDVIIKNIQLTPPPTSEKIVATKHCNGVDYWVITHPYNSNHFNAYLVTSSGINLTPVVSSVGTVEQTFCCGYFEAIGYLKVSPNGKKLGLCVPDFAPTPFFEIYDFDNMTGAVSNVLTVQCSGAGPNGNYNGPYGCCFSPDNSKFYITEPGSYFNRILEYDLSSGVPSQIISSAVTIADISPARPCALQLGPDAKMYICYEGGGDSIGVINFPDSTGPACNFQSRALTLKPGTNSREGFPNFIDGGLNKKTLATHNIIMCNTFTGDTADAGQGFLHYVWSTGDTTQKIFINSPGKYWVNVTNTGGCTATDTIIAYVITPTSFNLLHDTIVCSMNGLYFADAYLSGVSGYSWNTGEISSAKTFTTSGSYWVDYTFSNGCTTRDSFNLTLYEKPHPQLGTGVYCDQHSNFPEILDAGVGNGYHYNWSTGDTTRFLTIPNIGWYKVEVTIPVAMLSLPGDSGCTSTKDSVYAFSETVINHLHDTVLCSANQFPITYSVTIYHFSNPLVVACNVYTYSNGVDSGQIVGCYSSYGTYTFSIHSPGTYTITLVDIDGYNRVVCSYTDTAHVTINCNGKNEFENAIQTVSIYPNPSFESFNLESRQLLGPVSVYNILGERILTKDSREKFLKLDLSDQPPGTYFIRVDNHYFKILKE